MGQSLINAAHGNLNPPVELSALFCPIVGSRIEFAIPVRHNLIHIDAERAHQVIFHAEGPPFRQSEVVFLVTHVVGKTTQNHIGIRIVLQVVPQLVQFIVVFHSQDAAVEIVKDVIGETPTTWVLDFNRS